MGILIASYGGGVNSTAMLIEAARRECKPDLILFADTGGELPETYSYVAAFSNWLVGHSFPPITTVHKVTKTGERLTLEQNCLEKKMLPSVVYGYKSCSQKYKVQPQDKYVNNWPPAKELWSAGEKVTKWIGFDAGEERRATISEDAKYRYRYPLIEWDIDREHCVQIIQAAGLDLPGKSSCFFCPNSKPAEVIALAKSHPGYMERALLMERNANLTAMKGLAREWSWQQILDAHFNQFELFTVEKEMPCGCYD